MSIFIGSDGYGRFVIGWTDDTKAEIYARLNTAGVRELRNQLRILLREQDTDEQLTRVLERIRSLERSNAALRGALKRRRNKT